MLARIRVGTPLNLFLELRTQGAAEPQPHFGNLLPHLVLPLLSLGGNDKEADGSEHRCHHQAGDIGSRG